MQSNNSHKYSIFKRISLFSLLLLLVAVGINLYLMHVRNANQWYQIESEQLGRSLTQQAAKLVSGPLAKNDIDLVNQAIEVVNQGVFIQDAVIYDPKGVRFAREIESPSLLTLAQKMENEPLVFVEDIIDEGSIIGYIKLVLDKQAITKHHRDFNETQVFQSILLVVFALAIAFLITRIFYKAKYTLQLRDEQDTLL